MAHPSWLLHGPRPRTLFLAATLLMGVLPLPASPTLAHGGCNRIGVESRDGRVIMSSYLVVEPDFVARMHPLIDQNGQDGAWTVAAGELSSLGYTVTYTCIP